MVARDGNAARRINFANATRDELKQLTQACEGFDGAYCNAGKMNSECFKFSSSLDPLRTDLTKIIRGSLLEGEESTKNIEIEAYKLNTYRKGSFIKPHIDTPRSEKMFGSLVVIFPTQHEGGHLSLRHRDRGHEWIIDPGQVLAGGSGALDQPSIGYVAFLNNIEHDVAPVTSGHCVTLTYNLYFNDDGGPVSEKDAISEHLIPPKPPNQDRFREAFEALLKNPEFMAEGGTLAFGLRHLYPIKRTGFRDVRNILKASDAVVYQTTRALGFEPILYMCYYEDICGKNEGMIIDKPVTFWNFIDEDEDESVYRYIQEEGAIPVRQDGREIHYYDGYTGLDYDDDYLKNPEPVEWVTPITTYNRIEGVYATGAKSRIYSIYGDPCMTVRIGKAGDRLAYPTVAQIEKAYLKSGYRHGN